MAEPSLQLGNGNWAGKSGNLLAYHKANNNFYADELTFARASTGTIVNADGLIEQVPYNLVQQSNTFDTTWIIGASALDLTSGQSGYDGSNDAWLLKKNTSGSRFLQQSLSLSSAQYSYSVYIKAESTDWVLLWGYDGSTGVEAYFDLNNGVVGNTSGLDSTSVVNVGDGWFRCTIKYTQATTLVRIYPAYANGSVSTGTDSGIYIQDAQLVSGSTAKPYYPTTTRLNIPRVDYLNNANGSLLLEPQRTNLVAYSEDFSQWTAENATATINNVISPDGTQNGTKLTPTASSQRQAIKLAQSQNGDIVISCFAKKGEYDVIQITDAINGSYYVNFDLDNGVVGSSSVMIGEIENYGNGWYRCVSKYNSTSAINAVRFSIAQNATDGRLVNFAGNGTDSLYLYGAQVEQGSYATSIIPTSGTTVTRLADTSATTGLSDVINSTEGVLYAEMAPLFLESTSRDIELSDGGTNRVILQFNSTGIGSVLLLNGATQVNFSYALSDIQFKKIAFKYKANDFALWINGVEVATDSSGSTFSSGTLTRLDFNKFNPSSLEFYGNVKNLQIFKTALTDAELATLTTL